ncbi:MAG: hypothetical protein NVSMB38_13270 [Ktedonobacteraceae bacterium]
MKNLRVDMKPLSVHVVLNTTRKNALSYYIKFKVFYNTYTSFKVICDPLY